MSAPWGYKHRDEAGPRGWLARWWWRRRTRVIRENLRKFRP